MIDLASSLPKHQELMWPSLVALRDLGGSARVSEISDAVIKQEGFSEEQQAVKRREGDHMSMIDYRLAWARNDLKLAGFIVNSSRGVWALTEAGRDVQTEGAVSQRSRNGGPSTAGGTLPAAELRRAARSGLRRRAPTTSL